MKSFKRYISEARDSSVKGWIHPKSKKSYLTKRMRPYHVEFIIKKPRDFGTSEKEILDVLEKWNDSMDAPDPRDEAEKDLAKFKTGHMDTQKLVEYLAMKKGWYRVIGDSWASEISGIKINDKIIHDVLNIMEDEGVIPFDGQGIKQLEAREYQPDKGNAGYPDSKLVKLLVGDKIFRALRGKKTGKRTEIGRTMAMFREYIDIPPQSEWTFRDRMMYGDNKPIDTDETEEVDDFSDFVPKPNDSTGFTYTGNWMVDFYNAWITS